MRHNNLCDQEFLFHGGGWGGRCATKKKIFQIIVVVMRLRCTVVSEYLVRLAGHGDGM